MVAMVLEPSTEPVWPQDEKDEKRQIKIGGGKVSKVADLSMAREIVNELRVELPDRLFACMIKQPLTRGVPVDEYDYYFFYVSTTFSANPGITPRRLRLQLELKDVHNKPPLIPIACELYPRTEVTAAVTRVAELKIDFGQAVTKAIQTVFPAMPEVLTARTGGSIDIKKVLARVQAAGRNSHMPEWRIADAVINYDFNPACVVQVPKGAQLAVAANLHVEARKQWLGGVVFKTYFRTAHPMLYLLKGTDGKLVDGDKLPEGSRVTLRQPDVRSADNSGLQGMARARIGARPSGLRKAASDTPADPAASSVGRPASSGRRLKQQPHGAFVPSSSWPALTGKYVKVSPASLADAALLAKMVPDKGMPLAYTAMLTNKIVADKGTLAAYAALLAKMVPGKGTLVVEADRRPIGMIQYDEETINIHLASSQRNINAWVEAIRLVVQYMRDRLGHHRITSQPDIDDDFAITCYRRVGFRSVLGQMHQYRRGADLRFHDALFMEFLTNELTISTVTFSQGR